MVLCRYASDRSESLELVIQVREATPTVLSSHPILLSERDGWGEVFAVGVKLRQVGPIVFASASHSV